jgi:hypothetical protein
MLRPALLLSAALLTACAGLPPTAPPCKGACRSHDDGYQWAQSVDLRDARACTGPTEAFVDGCRDAVEDYRQMRSTKEGL